MRWWLHRPINIAMVVGAVLGAIVSAWFPLAACITGIILGLGPLGLTVRGRSARLVWTRRLKFLALVTGSMVAIISVLGLVILTSVAPLAFSAVLIPVFVDLALVITRPVESRLARRYVDAASKRLTAVGPVVVAITGSYGKTTTKEYVRHLVSGVRVVVASPASFNNTAGLCRTINEHLAEGTEVLVAEVGTYGKGEIRDICGWLRPNIGVITAIDAVHMERMGSLDNIAEAKAELLEKVDLAILSTDSPHLKSMAKKMASGKSVMRCGSVKDGNDVAVVPFDGQLAVYVSGEQVGVVRNPGVFANNVAAAISVALALDVAIEHILNRLESLPTPAHRQQVVTTSHGVRVIDDTYNSNPAGAASALRLLSRISNGGRRVVVSPGMIELGNEQYKENERFARNAATDATDIFIVGRTNLSAMRSGSRGGSATVRLVPTRDDAVRWVRENLTENDVVLYENDLPDHYP
ncbi:MAG: Mur ligase family protein [Pseudonocardiaceae bacterium]